MNKQLNYCVFYTGKYKQKSKLLSLVLDALLIKSQLILLILPHIPHHRHPRLQPNRTTNAPQTPSSLPHPHDESPPSSLMPAQVSPTLQGTAQAGSSAKPNPVLYPECISHPLKRTRSLWNLQRSHRQSALRYRYLGNCRFYDIQLEQLKVKTPSVSCVKLTTQPGL